MACHEYLLILKKPKKKTQTLKIDFPEILLTQDLIF